MSTEQVEQLEEGDLQATDGVIQLPDGGTIRTFSPPRGFDPPQASDAELLANGFPERPAEGELLEAWLQTVRCTPIEPIFRRQEAPGSTQPMAVDQYRAPTWTGFLLGRPGQGRMKAVRSAWVVPNVYLPSGALNDTWYWVRVRNGFYEIGRDFHVGVRNEVVFVSQLGNIARKFVPYCEFWDSSGPKRFDITNLSVSAGDVVACYIELLEDPPGVPVSAKVYLGNVTSGTAVNFVVSPGGSVTLPSQGALWIVDTEGISPAPLKLARFGTVYLELAVGKHSSGEEVLAGTEYPIQMWQIDRHLAYSGVTNPYTVWSKYGPPLNL